MDMINGSYSSNTTGQKTKNDILSDDSAANLTFIHSLISSRSSSSPASPSSSSSSFPSPTSPLLKSHSSSPSSPTSTSSSFFKRICLPFVLSSNKKLFVQRFLVILSTYLTFALFIISYEGYHQHQHSIPQHTHQHQHELYVDSTRFSLLNSFKLSSSSSSISDFVSVWRICPPRNETNLSPQQHQDQHLGYGYAHPYSSTILSANWYEVNASWPLRSSDRPESKLEGRDRHWLKKQKLQASFRFIIWEIEILEQSELDPSSAFDDSSSHFHQHQHQQKEAPSSSSSYPHQSSTIESYYFSAAFSMLSSDFSYLDTLSAPKYLINRLEKDLVVKISFKTSLSLSSLSTTPSPSSSAFETDWLPVKIHWTNEKHIPFIQFQIPTGLSSALSSSSIIFQSITFYSPQYFLYLQVPLCLHKLTRVTSILCSLPSPASSSSSSSSSPYLSDWISYHFALGFDKIILFDRYQHYATSASSPFDSSLVEIEVTPFPKQCVSLDFDQTLLTNLCLMKHRRRTEFLFVLQQDEFFEIFVGDETKRKENREKHSCIDEQSNNRGSIVDIQKERQQHFYNHYDYHYNSHCLSRLQEFLLISSQQSSIHGWIFPLLPFFRSNETSSSNHSSLLHVLDAYPLHTYSFLQQGRPLFRPIGSWKVTANDVWGPVAVSPSLSFEIHHESSSKSSKVNRFHHCAVLRTVNFLGGNTEYFMKTLRERILKETKDWDDEPEYFLWLQEKVCLPLSEFSLENVAGRVRKLVQLIPSSIPSSVYEMELHLKETHPNQRRNDDALISNVIAESVQRRLEQLHGPERDKPLPIPSLSWAEQQTIIAAFHWYQMLQWGVHETTEHSPGELISVATKTLIDHKDYKEKYMVDDFKSRQKQNLHPSDPLVNVIRQAAFWKPLIMTKPPGKHSNRTLLYQEDPAVRDLCEKTYW